MKKLLTALFVIIGFVLILPVPTEAQFTERWGDVLSCTGNYLASSPKGYCTSVCDILKTFKNIIDFGLTMILFVVAPAYFLYSGFLIMTAGGSDAKWGQAKEVMRKTILGILLVLSSYLIISTFLWAVGNPADGVKWPNIDCDPAKMPGGEINIQKFKEPIPNASST